MLKEKVLQRYRRWLNRRIPPAREVILNQRRIFIFPSLQGGCFVFLVILLLLVAVNYRNNLAFVLAFLLFSLFVVAILHTYSNLSGLVIRAGHTRACFAGEDAEFEVILRRQAKRAYYGITTRWPESTEQLVDLAGVNERSLKLYHRTFRRGRQRAGRLLIETRYPLGLLRAWSWVDLNMTCIVYPRALRNRRIPATSRAGMEGAIEATSGAGDFYGFREYVPGDSLKHLSWRGVAKGQALLTRQYVEYIAEQVWLDWDDFHDSDPEVRLEKICYWVLELSKTESEFGLRLPGLEVAPAKGEHHKAQLLRCLALYGLDARSSL